MIWIYFRTVIFLPILLAIFVSLNIVIFTVKRSFGQTQVVHNQIQHANPNVGQDGKNKNIIDGKYFVSSTFIVILLATPFLLHPLQLDISIRFEVSLLIFQTVPSSIFMFIFLWKHGLKSISILKEAFCWSSLNNLNCDIINVMWKIKVQSGNSKKKYLFVSNVLVSSS